MNDFSFVVITWFVIINRYNRGGGGGMIYFKTLWFYSDCELTSRLKNEQQVTRLIKQYMLK